MIADGTTLPGGLEIAAGMSPWLQALILMVGTFILEDTTAIAAGLLAHTGTISMPVAMLGTGIGIFVGDLGLYVLGAAAARGARGTAWIRRRLPDAQLARVSRWFAGSGWKAIVLSRFVSGSRLPIYLGAGFVGAGFARFAAWTFVAVAIWTPLVVGATAWLGSSLLAAAERLLGTSPVAWIVAAVAVIALMQLAILALTRRRATHLALLRAMRFEFWPIWAVYAPLLPFFAWNGLRFGFARTLTAVNPCWPDSGVVGESKQLGLEAFDGEFVSPSFRIAPAEGTPSDGRAYTAAHIDEALCMLEARGWTRGWTQPVIVKPDAGQRGLAVKVVRSEAGVRTLLADARAPLVVQRFEAGACEVGLFFIRDPGTRGRLFSICDKRFAHATGDGRSTLRELITRDARLRLQERVFLERMQSRLDEIPAAGVRIRLGNAGNHAQGCLFVDGERLRTPELEAWVLRACEHARGFNYGRLDVRFPDEAACMRGEGGVILEANGITSESTNMYDPSFGAWRAWRIMFAHWRAAFLIGAANRQRGVQGLTLREVLRRRRAWRESASRDDVAD
jgi:membrane protein DedA with SNARE-associated domain